LNPLSAVAVAPVAITKAGLVVKGAVWVVEVADVRWSALKRPRRVLLPPPLLGWAKK
jgi:hypothetical protein